MAEVDKDKLNKYYKDTFDVDFSKLTPEDIEQLDGFLKEAGDAQQPYFVTPQGAIVPNPARERIKARGGMNPDDAYGLGLYANYKFGIMPQQLDRELLRKRKVPEDQLDRLQKEYDDNFAKDITNRFAEFVQKDPDKKAVKSNKNEIAFEPEEITASPTTTVNKPKNTVSRDGVEIPIPTRAEEKKFQEWAKKNGIKEPFNPDQHFDYVSAFRNKEGRAGGKDGHFTDKYKLPGHETFSDESQYAVGENKAKAGSWDEEVYLPPLPEIQPPPPQAGPTEGPSGPGGPLGKAPMDWAKFGKLADVMGPSWSLQEQQEYEKQMGVSHTPPFKSRPLSNEWTKEILVEPRGSKNGKR